MKQSSWFVFIYFVLSALSWAADSSQPPPENFQKSVVLIRSYQQAYDWLIPWNKKALQQRHGAALVLPQQQLLTTAELVKNHTLIEIRKPGEERPYEAATLLTDYAVNLALLHVPDPAFWSGLSPVAWGNPKMSEGRVGHWKNLNEWESMAAKVKQLFIGFRSRSQAHFPIVKVVASLKNRVQGNPLIQDNRVSGMIMQSRDSNLDAIPAPFLQAFIEKAATVPYQSFPQRGFSWQPIPQTSVREYLQIDPAYTGILINRVFHYGTGSDVLQPDDFLISIAGEPLSNDGKIAHPEWGNILFDYLFATQFQETALSLEIVRQGKRMTLQTQLTDFPAESYSVPLQTVKHPPNYVLRGGLLFQELNMNYLQLWGKDWMSKAPARLSIYQQLEAHLPANKDRRLILLTRVLPMPINIGYQKLTNLIVSEINGIPIRQLKDVVTAFQNPQNGFHQVRFLPGSNRAYLVLPEGEMERSDQQILQRFQIPHLERF